MRNLTKAELIGKQFILNTEFSTDTIYTIEDHKNPTTVILSWHSPSRGNARDTYNVDNLNNKFNNKVWKLLRINVRLSTHLLKLKQ